MASLDRLIPELLLSIAAYITADHQESPSDRDMWCCQHDLASLARVNRRFRNIFDPILWRFNRVNGRLRWATHSELIWLDNISVMSAILWAAVNDRTDILDKAHEYQLTLGSPRQYQPLYMAAEKGNKAALYWFLNHGLPVDEDPTNGDGRQDLAEISASPLYAAIEAGKESTAVALLSRGARIRFLSRIDNFTQLESAIHTAARCGLRNVIKYLVKYKGVDINEVDHRFMTPLHHAAMQTDDQPLIKAMTDLGANPNIETSVGLPLTVAISYRHFNAALALLEAGSNVSPSKTNRWAGSSLVECAATATGYCWDPIKLEDQRALIRRLIANGADVDEEFDGRTPLDAAVPVGTSGAVYELLRAGADTHKRSGYHNLTPFESIWGPQGVESLTMKARLFVAAGARLDVPDDSDGKTPLETAIDYCTSREDPRPLASILDIANQQNMRGGYLNELFRDCLIRQRLQAAKLLMRHGAILETEEGLIYQWASEVILQDRDDEGHREFSFCLDFRLPRYQLEALFSYALDAPNEERCHILIDRGVLLLRKEPKPWLHKAAKRGSSSLIRRMCGAGMDVNALNDKSETPMMLAMDADYPHIADLLFELGADPFHPLPKPGGKKLGRSAFAYAICIKRSWKQAKRWWLEAPVESMPAKKLYHSRLSAARNGDAGSSHNHNNTSTPTNGKKKLGSGWVPNGVGKFIDREKLKAAKDGRLGVDYDTNPAFESDLYYNRSTAS
ncbi:ankyrin [Hypomontagnella submonticulosa]|nr:ankyrin [Hypomontagnella submonticulosa]